MSQGVDNYDMLENKRLNCSLAATLINSHFKKIYTFIIFNLSKIRIDCKQEKWSKVETKKYYVIE